MSGRTIFSTSFHLLLAVSLSFSNLCRAEEPPTPPDNTTSAEAQVLSMSEMKLLTIKTIVSTVVSTVSHTVMLYPTCTTTGPGVSACPGPNTLPPHLTSAVPPTVAVTPWVTTLYCFRRGKKITSSRRILVLIRNIGTEGADWSGEKRSKRMILIKIMNWKNGTHKDDDWVQENN